ncbi:DUF938 domain-containing protein [Rhizobium sp. Root483D2]|uniref:DUF938 domain-containing protein n=1 Tax=Rhizobium sp. Root483D2 TaxID=1736545 RepID=UPI000714B395|nr:DUF938 domain-containing protein [Rhizobium sp. Root483D2]KQY49043.1 hypothetical protein ASD32_01770 [Rhizobium sp. Root483D2]
MLFLDSHDEELINVLSGQLIDHSQYVEIGAGNGSTALYFKTLFPAASVLAVEALQSTHLKLEKNCEGRGIRTQRATVSSVVSAPIFDGSLDLGRTTTLDQLTDRMEHVDLLKISTVNLATKIISGSARTISKTSILTMPVSGNFRLEQEEAHHSKADLMQEQIDLLGFPFVYCFMDRGDLVQAEHVPDVASILEGSDGDHTLVFARGPIPAITPQGYLFKVFAQRQ